MKISYNWLQTYFKENLPNPKDVSDIFNLRALEVEEVEEKDGDSILEIKVTPNRAPDCLSHIGIAKEIALHTGLKITNPPSEEKIPHDFETKWSVSMQDNSCVRYMAREISDVVVDESPLELKYKLESIGQRSINTIVDITNLVMYEIGQPMHAFDRDKLEGEVIKIASPIDTHFVTLDNKEVELTQEDFTIQDAKDNLAIAGVKGGKKAEVDSKTKNIILESANFFAVSVRKTSKRTGIQTDSSKRYENGITPILAEYALHLASFYIKKYASNSDTKFSNILDVYPRPQKRKYTIGLTKKHISEKLGIEISDEKIEYILTGLDIEYKIINPRNEIIEHAHNAIGKSYRWGASVLFDAPDVFDCASLTAYLYSMAGFSIPRISVDQYVFFKKISKEEALPGDLIFSNTGKDLGHGIHTETKEFLPGTLVSEGIDHVGVYLGNDEVLHTSSSTGEVCIQKISEAEFFKDIKSFGSIINEETKYRLEIPFERLDLKTEIDIIEEIGRVYGYEHIPPQPLNLEEVKNISEYEKIATLKTILYTNGFNEVITYSFVKKGDISVVKPLAKDKSYLRTNLTIGLSEALDLNFRNRELFREDVVQIFEVGNIFLESGEKTILGVGVRSGQKKIKSKEILENIVKIISEKIGMEISVEIKDQQEVIEIDLSDIIKRDFEIENKLYPLEHILYKPFSLYPYMTRDIAVWANSTKTKEDIENIIVKYGGELLYRYDLFDEFSKDGKTSYGYRLVFQSFERTLTDEEINPIMEKIYNTLGEDPDFEIR